MNLRRPPVTTIEDALELLRAVSDKKTAQDTFQSMRALVKEGVEAEHRLAQCEQQEARIRAGDLELQHARAAIDAERDELRSAREAIKNIKGALELREREASRQEAVLKMAEGRIIKDRLDMEAVIAAQLAKASEEKRLAIIDRKAAEDVKKRFLAAIQG